MLNINLFISTSAETENSLMAAFLTDVLSVNRWTPTNCACHHLELPGRQKPIPYVLVAFAMRLNIMKPYAQRGLTMVQRVFNYRLSRARCIIENVFGIMSASTIIAYLLITYCEFPSFSYLLT